MEEDRVCKMMEMLRSGWEEELKLAETRMLEAIRLETHRLNQIVTGNFTEVERMLKDPSPTPDPKTLELCFSDKISQPLLTGGEIKGDGIDCIRVVLRESSTRNIVDIGPIASASVEIVVLGQGTDDWTGEEFDEKIVRVEGKPPLLTVNECKLQGGIGVLENVKFRHHAIDVKPSEFRLGARIAEKFDGIIVKEAKTESFAIKSYRCKYTKKNEIPNLSDKIWVLNNIQRRGNIDKRLQAEGVDSVEKFLIQLLIDDQKLENITGLGRKKWEAAVNHARKCESDKVYWYTNSQGNPGVVFDIFGKLQGLYSEGQFFAANMLSENKKVDADNLLSSAFENWKNVEPFDDLNSLQQHLAATRASFEPPNYFIPGHPDTNPDTGASEMMDGSNNMEDPDPLFTQGGVVVSDMPHVALGDPFDIKDLDYMSDFPWWISGMLCECYGVQQNSIDEMNIDARLSGVVPRAGFVPEELEELDLCPEELDLCPEELEELDLCPEELDLCPELNLCPEAGFVSRAEFEVVVPGSKTQRKRGQPCSARVNGSLSEKSSALKPIQPKRRKKNL